MIERVTKEDLHLLGDQLIGSVTKITLVQYWLYLPWENSCTECYTNVKNPCVQRLYHTPDNDNVGILSAGLTAIMISP